MLYNWNILVPKVLLLGLALYLHVKIPAVGAEMDTECSFSLQLPQESLGLLWDAWEGSEMPVTVTCAKNYLLVFMLIFSHLLLHVSFSARRKLSTFTTVCCYQEPFLSLLFPSPEVVT